MTRVAKFYKAVETGKESGGFVVRLDGKPVKTPARALLALPTPKLADAIAEEWRAQSDVLDPTTMPLTRFAYAAIDVAPTHRARLTEEILAYGKSDLLCYRAEAPAALIARQNEAWNPLLDWAAQRFGARLTDGDRHRLCRPAGGEPGGLREGGPGRDDFALVALHGAASLTGSLVSGARAGGGPSHGRQGVRFLLPRRNLPGGSLGPGRGSGGARRAAGRRAGRHRTVPNPLSPLTLSASHGLSWPGFGGTFS